MKKSLLFTLLITLSLFARQKMIPVQSCEAFNNMKHSQNSHHVLLDTQKNYTVLDHHKGQYLVLIKGEQPAQRWVDESCFSRTLPSSKSFDTWDDKTVQPKHTNKYENSNKSKDTLLALSWHNAFCETHRNKKECKRDMFTLFRSKHRETHFTLHGLWPQPASRAYCGVERKYITMDKYKHWNKLPEPKLSTKTKAALKKVMPGVVSNLHRHEWIKHGTCYGTDAQTYFDDAVSLTNEVRRSPVSDFFRKNAGKRVTLTRVRELFDNTFGKGAGSHVELRCKEGMITEIWLHLGRGGQSLEAMFKEGRKIHSRCLRGIIDRSGYR